MHGHAHVLARPSNCGWPTPTCEQAKITSAPTSWQLMNKAIKGVCTCTQPRMHVRTTAHIRTHAHTRTNTHTHACTNTHTMWRTSLGAQAGDLAHACSRLPLPHCPPAQGGMRHGWPTRAGWHRPAQVRESTHSAHLCTRAHTGWL